MAGWACERAYVRVCMLVLAHMHGNCMKEVLHM